MYFLRKETDDGSNNKSTQTTRQSGKSDYAFFGKAD